jgi:hypothetical protein
MSNSRIYIIIFIIALAMGCSDGTESGKIFSIEQGHPENWVDPAYRDMDDFHVTPVLNVESGVYDYESCQECHGSLLEGGISGISCYSCHNGPDGSFGHPDGWRIYYDASLFHSRYAKEFLVSCTSVACHGGDLTGGDLGPTCFTSGCHEVDEEWNIY